jgi:DMSO/TMAO reductase YedYZ molybdopterin-dependent catalytic subunit
MAPAGAAADKRPSATGRRQRLVARDPSASAMDVPDRGRLAPAPRLVDWSLFAATLAALATGVLGLGAGHPSAAVLFLLHGVLGLSTAVLLVAKLRRVAGRLTTLRAWDRTTPVSVLAAAAAALALATGIAWSLGATVELWYWTLLNAHILFGLVVVPLVLVHLRDRFRPPRVRDLDGRRDAIRYAGLLVGGALAVRAGDALAALLDTDAAAARFTGSRPTGDGDGDDAGNDAFPVTSWVADDPDPVGPDWRLRVDGLVDRPLALDRDALGPAATATDRALLDCTSGWYTVQDWRGIRLGDLLDRAGVRSAGRWVVVWSVTGYRWSFPLAEAREMVLATAVGGEPLSHGHGAPVRLVAPDRRGFQWVKWVERVEVRRHRDATQYLATLVSGL